MSDYYLQQVKDDVEFYAGEYLTPSNIDADELAEMDRDDVEEYLNDHLWDDDSVTGNGPGSYTYNREEAKKYVLEDAFETIVEAINEGMYDKSTFADCIINDDWETLDVVSRCTVLGQAIAEVLDEHPELIPKKD